MKIIKQQFKIWMFQAQRQLESNLLSEVKSEMWFERILLSIKFPRTEFGVKSFKV